MKLASIGPVEFLLLDALQAVGNSVLAKPSSYQFCWVARQAIKLERSEEDPPLVKNRDGSWQDLCPDFEEVLGSYDVKARKITIYKKGILWCASSPSRDWNPARLEKIVELHEWAHVLHHLGPIGHFEQSIRARELRLRSSRYRKAPAELKEQIAQLLTLLSIREAARVGLGGYATGDFSELEKMFFALMKDQSTRYHLPEVARAMCFGRLREKTRLILAWADKEFFPSLAEIHGILA